MLHSSDVNHCAIPHSTQSQTQTQLFCRRSMNSCFPVTTFCVNFTKTAISHVRLCRSSRSQMFFKIAALKSFTNSKGKHLGRSLFSTTLQAFPPTTSGDQLYQKETTTKVLFCEICKIFKNHIFFHNTYGDCSWLWQKSP